MRSAWALALALLLVLAPVFAAGEATPMDATIEGSDVYDVSATNNSVNIQAGYVYKVGLKFLELSKWWAGIYGLITGKIVLGNSDRDTFFEWTISELPKYVVITHSNDVNWESIQPTTATDFENILRTELSDLGHAWDPSSNESVSNTFTEELNCDLPYGNTAAALVYGDFDGDGNVTKEWPVCAYKARNNDDNADRAVYVARVAENGKAYNNEPAHYEAIVAATQEGTGVTIHFWKVDLG